MTYERCSQWFASSEEEAVVGTAEKCSFSPSVDSRKILFIIDAELCFSVYPLSSSPHSPDSPPHPLVHNTCCVLAEICLMMMVESRAAGV